MPYSHKQPHRIIGGHDSQGRVERMMIHGWEERISANLDAVWGRALPAKRGVLNDYPAKKSVDSVVKKPHSL